MYNIIPAGLNPIANNSAQWAANNPIYCTDLPGGICNPPVDASLVDISFYNPDSGMPWPPSLFTVNLSVDGVPKNWQDRNPLTLKFSTPISVRDTIDLHVDYLYPAAFNARTPMDIVFTFQNKLPHTLVKGTFLYDYNSKNVTQPVLSTGMLEVGIW
jgi:hypothetical protein